jgi:TfoX/Sxy family transcriptional regulator of competence genes
VARNEKLEARIRSALEGVTNMAEMKMFRGMALMVNDKLCISAGDEELMFRFDPLLHDELRKQQGCREMLRNGKAIKGYLYVHESVLKTKKDLDRWVTLSLDYNKSIKAAGRKKANP